MADAVLVRACPECGTRFRITLDLLEVAGGQVRCGACLTVFNAREVGADAASETFDAGAESGVSPLPQEPDVAAASQIDAPSQLDAPSPRPQEPEFTPPPPPAAFGGPLETVARDDAAPPDAGGGGVQEDEQSSALPAAFRADVHRADPTPVTPQAQLSPQARMGARAALAASALPKTSTPPGTGNVAAPAGRPAARARRPRGASRPGVAGPFFLALLLAALLVVGISLVYMPVWSLQPELRRAYEVACDVIGCRVPTPNAPTAWRLQTNAVARPGPPAPLTLSVEFVNKAAYKQALPTVAVRFTDDDGELVAEERLTPRDYQAERPAERAAPNKPKVLRLRFADPGAEATHYQLAILAS